MRANNHNWEIHFYGKMEKLNQFFAEFATIQNHMQTYVEQLAFLLICI